MPEEARWEALLAAASQPDIGKRIDDALDADRAARTPACANVLPRVYARAPLSAELMGSLVETIAKIGFGDDAEEARDILGRTYEYFIKEFARAEGHRGGEFFTPAPGRAAAGRDARAVRGPRARPGLRLLRAVRPVGAGSSRRTAAAPTRSRSTARSATRRPGGSGG